MRKALPRSISHVAISQLLSWTWRLTSSEVSKVPSVVFRWRAVVVPGTKPHTPRAMSGLRDHVILLTGYPDVAQKTKTYFSILVTSIQDTLKI